MSPDLSALQQVLDFEGPPRVADEPVSSTMIRSWCRAIGETNPVYLDPAAAERSVHGGLVAPPAMLQVWTQVDRRLAPPGEANTVEDRAARVFAEAGYHRSIATNCHLEIFRYLRPGDLISHRARITSVSELKETRLGQGFFVTRMIDYLDQDERAVGRVLFRSFRFQHPYTLDGARQAVDDAVPAKGRAIPSESIAITPTLVICSAIASRDFHPVHHDHRTAERMGFQDIFMDPMAACGLVSRWLTDWSGQDTRIRSLALRSEVPNFPGNTMVLSGTVDLVRPRQDLVEVTIVVRSSNEFGRPLLGTATLEITQETAQRLGLHP